MRSIYRSIRLLAAGAMLVAAHQGQAGLFPKLLKESPQELMGDYVLVARQNPDQTREEFKTNGATFASIQANRIVLADGTVRAIEGIVRVRQGNTNVFVKVYSAAD